MCKKNWLSSKNDSGGLVQLRKGYRLLEVDTYDSKMVNEASFQKLNAEAIKAKYNELQNKIKNDIQKDAEEKRPWVERTLEIAMYSSECPQCKKNKHVTIADKFYEDRHVKRILPVRFTGSAGEEKSIINDIVSIQTSRKPIVKQITQKRKQLCRLIEKAESKANEDRDYEAEIIQRIEDNIPYTKLQSIAHVLAIHTSDYLEINDLVDDSLDDDEKFRDEESEKEAENHELQLEIIKKIEGMQEGVPEVVEIGRILGMESKDKKNKMDTAELEIVSGRAPGIDTVVSRFLQSCVGGEIEPYDSLGAVNLSCIEPTDAIKQEFGLGQELQIEFNNILNKDYSKEEKRNKGIPADLGTDLDCHEANKIRKSALYKKAKDNWINSTEAQQKQKITKKAKVKKSTAKTNTVLVKNNIKK